jgi:chromosome segregation ATPase
MKQRSQTRRTREEFQTELQILRELRLSRKSESRVETEIQDLKSEIQNYQRQLETTKVELQFTKTALQATNERFENLVTETQKIAEDATLNLTKLKQQLKALILKLSL